MATNSLQNIVRNRDTIRKIMAMDKNGQMDSILENARREGVVSFSEEGVNYNPTQPTSQQKDDLEYTAEDLQNSKLPQSILESFKTNKIESMRIPASVLDGIDIKPIQEVRKEKPIRESISTPIPSSNSSIDYSLLKTIINEAVRENMKKYAAAMTKKIISESTSSSNNVQAIKLGNKFSFITENGDIYEATLKYKSNLNEQKKIK